MPCMRLSLRDERGSGEGAAATLDVELGSLAPDLSIGELLELLAVRFPERLTTVAGAELSIDDQPVDPVDPLSGLPLWAGSVLTLRGPGRPTALKHRGPHTELTRLAGPGSGASIRLEGGTFAVGRSPRPGLEAGPVTRAVFRVDVDPDTGVAVLSGAGGEPDGTVRVDGCPLPVVRQELDERGASRVVAAEDAVFRIATRRTVGGPGGLVGSPDGEPDRTGRMPHLRTPRVATPAPSAQVPVPELPAPASAPQPLSWLMMLAPLPIGVVMALVFSPLFLLMTTMTPVMALARWAEGKWRARKDGIRITAETAQAKGRFAADLEHRRRIVEAAARAGYADLSELAARARSGRRLWEVRPGDDDELQVVIGFGALPWHPELGRAGDVPAVTATFRDVLGEQDHLLDVPVEVDLRERTGLGVVGSGTARRLAQTAVVDLVVRHGPADVALALLVSPDLLPAWEWTKWLPHLTGSDACPRVAAGGDAAVALLGRLVDESAARASGPRLLRSGDDVAPVGPARTVIVIDGDDLLTGRVAALLGRLARGGARTLVVATRPDRLPSVCGSLVEPEPDGTVTVTDAITGRRTHGVLAIQASADVCTQAARGLARWTDPEQATPDAAVPDRTRLVDLLLASASGPEGLGRPVDTLDPATVAALWLRGGSGLRAVLGAGENGDVSVDLLSDGPHGLVVGTTGAGKSELLRSLVASLACTRSPDELTFLLVDFKGGGAFDACVGLPHTVGMVTDLDEHLAARALRCLRAELRHRERRLREAGVSDLRDLLMPSPPLPRLVIVIDEFATLAAELPGFLSALVDVAQRGRSLGIHLILATQRPQGVVDAKIRSNTNLRIALRVQDEADSRDVLGTRQAADIDRRRPGRAFVRLGAGEVVALQSAYVSAPAPRERTDRIEVTPFDLLPVDPSGELPADPQVWLPVEPAPAGGTTTDLADLVRLTRAVAEQGGYAAPRTPWPAPLPERVDAWTLPEDGGPGPVALGLVDLPDEQRTDYWRWQPQVASTLVLGADATDVTAVLAAACLALARNRAPEVQQIIVIDGLGSEMQALEHLPHVRAAVSVDDAERLSRVLDLVDAEIAARRTGAGARPELLVVLAGWAQVVESAERAGVLEAAQRLERVLRDGASAGVRLLVSAAHERAIPSRVMAQLGTKLCLRLSDPSSYTGLGLRARDVPDLQGLRALDLSSQRELQIAGYGDGSGTEHAEAARRVGARYPAGVTTSAAGLGVLGVDISPEEVLGSSTIAGTAWRLGLGRCYRDLGIVTLSLAPGMHVVVAGPPGSGRTSALRMLATAACAADAGALVQVVSPDPAEWTDLPLVDAFGSLGEIIGPPQGQRRLLLVDDVESLGTGSGAALDRLLSTAPAQTHVVIAGRPDAFRGIQVWQRALALSRTGLLLRPTSDDGDVLRIRLPREAPLRPVPGRGYLVEAGVPEQVQVARIRTPEAMAPDRLERRCVDLPLLLGRAVSLR
jgi:DNA segregation ATPase FtsK/SpoIIIE, S-DNA-T family